MKKKTATQLLCPPVCVHVCLFSLFVCAQLRLENAFSDACTLFFSGQLFCIRLSGAWQIRISCRNAGVCRCVCEQTQLAIGSIQKPYGQTPEKQHHSTLRWQIRLPKPRAGFGLGFASWCAVESAENNQPKALNPPCAGTFCLPRPQVKSWGRCPTEHIF